MRTKLAIVVATLAIGAGGCAVGPRLTRARTLPAGEVELVAGSSLSLVGAGETKFPAGTLDSNVRIGLADRFELGAGARGAWTPQISLFGAGADLKLQLLEGSIELAIDPGINWDAIITAGELGHLYTFSLPLVAGLNIDGGHQLILAPAFLDTWAVSRGAAAVHQPYFGGAIGFELRADQNFTLLPSAGLYYSPVGPEASGGTAVLNLSLGASFKL